MNLDVFLSFCFVVGSALFAVAFQWKRRSWKSGRAGFFPTTAALGNALHALQEFTQPQVRYVIREEMDEAAEDDEDGGPEDPVAHLLLQARKIRRGRLTRPITARWRPGGGEPEFVTPASKDRSPGTPISANDNPP